VYLVRHGETEWNRLGMLQGTADVPLSAAGRAQVTRLAAELHGVHLDAAYSSPLGRARETAVAICAGRDLPVRMLDDLREIGYGRWQGLDPAAREADDASLQRRWHDDPWGVTFPGGESLADVDARARRALDHVARAHPGHAVLVSAHGHLNRVLLLAARGWPRERFWSVEQSNASCTVLDLAPAPRELREAV
jgi:broad specificity phosphatase PhoE